MSRVYPSRLGFGVLPTIAANGPRLLSVDPAVGDETGGDALSIFGANLNGAVTAVTVGGSAATSVVHVSDRKITCTTPAGTGTDDVVVTIGGKQLTLASAFTYQAGGGGPTLVFASDWGTATGTSSNALNDGGLWDGATVQANQMEVVSASGLGFPAGMSNVLRMVHLGVENGSAQIGYGNELLGEVGVGETRHWRIYHRSDLTIGDCPSTCRHHPLQMGDAGGLVAFWMRYTPPNGDPPAEFELEFYDRRQPDHSWSLTANGNTDVNTGAVWRYEWAITRTVGDYGILQIRIYDENGDLYATGGDFGCKVDGNAHQLDDAVEDQGNGENLYWPDQGGDDAWERTGGMRLVATPDGYGAGLYQYWGGYAVSDENWCGEYSSGEGP